MQDSKLILYLTRNIFVIFFPREYYLRRQLDMLRYDK